MPQAFSEALSQSFSSLDCVLTAAEKLNAHEIRWLHDVADVFDRYQRQWYRLVSSEREQVPRFLWDVQGNVEINESEVNSDRNLTAKHKIDSVRQAAAQLNQGVIDWPHDTADVFSSRSKVRSDLSLQLQNIL